MSRIALLSGTGHEDLAESIAKRLSIPLSEVNIKKFSNLETCVEIVQSVRGQHVFIIQSFHNRDPSRTLHTSPSPSTSPPSTQPYASHQKNDPIKFKSIHQHLMELFILIHACKIASAQKITVVLPYFPYSKQPNGPYDKLPFHMKYQMNIPPPSNLPNTFKAPTNYPTVNSNVSLSPRLSCGSLIPINSSAPIPINHPENTNCDAKLTNNSFSSQMYRPWRARSGKLIANLLEKAGTDHIITMDLHDPQYEGFFHIPVDNLKCEPLFLKQILLEINMKWKAQNCGFVVVSPDAGGVKRALSISEKLGVDFAMVHKEKKNNSFTSPPLTPSSTPRPATPIQQAILSTSPDYLSNDISANCPLSLSYLRLIGDVNQRIVFMVDDIADSCHTLIKAASLCVNYGAAQVIALISHGIFSEDALDRLQNSCIEQVLVSNSLPFDALLLEAYPKIKIIDIAPLFAEAIRRSHHGESVSVLSDRVPI